jgi:hypothetical protein
VPEGVLALHLWESHAWQKYLKDLTPESVRSGKTTFATIAHRFLPDVPGRKVLNQAETFDGLDFQKMDAICAEVDFVNPVPDRKGLVKRFVSKASSLLTRPNTSEYRQKSEPNTLLDFCNLFDAVGKVENKKITNYFAK